MKSSEINIKSLVVFLILMQNDDGIIGKSPDYIEEKANACFNNRRPEWLLDGKGLFIFNQWHKAWNQCNHSYAWSGEVPCTGIYCCVYCGKPKDETSINGTLPDSYHYQGKIKS